jgi:hypothetical protein
MSLLSRNDEQIRVGYTNGLIDGSSSFIFDGTLDTPDYRWMDIVISELQGRGILRIGLDYLWNSDTGKFEFIDPGDAFVQGVSYNVHFQRVSVVGSILMPDPVYFIDGSFFIRDINIPNIGVRATDEKINSFIEKYEPECLIGVLGRSLYDLLYTESSQRISWLISGTDFIDGFGNNVKWRGFVYDRNISLIAYYIYYYYQEASITHTTGVAVKKSNVEAGISVSPIDKMSRAWNKFCDESEYLLAFLWFSKTEFGTRIYPEFDNNRYWISKRFIRKTNLFGI